MVKWAIIVGKFIASLANYSEKGNVSKEKSGVHIENCNNVNINLRVNDNDKPEIIGSDRKFDKSSS